MSQASTESDGLTRIRELLEPEPTLMEHTVGGERIFEGCVLDLDHLEVELDDGSRAWREVVRNPGGAGVVAIRDGCVCLVRQYRIALGRMTLEIPAGKLEHGEPGEICAARELAEEAGLTAEKLIPLVSTVGAPGFSNECTQVFLAKGLSQGAAHPDPGEFVNVVWLPVNDVVAAIRAGLVQDAKTVSGILAALTFGC